MLRPSVLAFLIPLFLTFNSGNGLAQRDGREPIQLINGYPEFHLHGQPFFAHSAAFFYNRIPHDEWGASLVKLKEMGINTVDLYIAWNWHEPEEGKLDFDGHSNPRRDVKQLLEMIDEMGFAVIVRPGPVILNEWRNGGYPGWLLARPEFQMNDVARRDGHYPPLSGLGASNSEEASRQWLANETHLKYTRKWVAGVMRELLKDRQATNGGNVIAIQLDDDQAINRTNYNGPVFWKYMNTLAGYLREAGATVPLYINPTDMRVSAAGAPHGIGAMGQWYFNFGTDPTLRWEDTATLQFYVETLKTQPHFPPMIIEYQAGWYGTGDDSYARTADPTNTLLSSRVMLGHGLRGLNYFPVQDTIYPAGYEVPWANHSYAWESALNLSREERARASAVYRNGRLIALLGTELAAAHKVADIGLVYPISSYDQASLTRDDILRISRAQMQIQQYCQLNQVSVEYIDLEFQPLEQLKRHKALLLPVFDEETLAQIDATGREEVSAANEPNLNQHQSRLSTQPARLRLSEIAQRKLVDYVNGGGRLICSPVAPQGEIIKELFGLPRTRAVFLPDYWRGVPVEPGKMKREEVLAKVNQSSKKFLELLQNSFVQRVVTAQVKTEGSQRQSNHGSEIEPNFIATALVADEVTPHGSPLDLIFSREAHSFINVANFDSQKTMSVRLKVIPSSGLRLNDPSQAITLPEFALRPRDALLLPVRYWRIDCATAELVNYEDANGRLKMRFYAPEPADLSLRFLPATSKVQINGVPVKALFDEDHKRLNVKLIPPAGSRGGDESGRRQQELDVEVTYDTVLPVINVNPPRFIIGETNPVIVELMNPASKSLKGELQLNVLRGHKIEKYRRSIAVALKESQQVKFDFPLSAKAIAGDHITLWTTFSQKKEDAPGDDVYSSLTTTAEILPRFSWRVFPKSSWPLRADTQAAIDPPLLYPSDDNATQATFNLRLGNNTAEEVTLARKSMLVNSLPLKLRSGEEYLSTYTYNFAPGTKSALNPFAVSVSDGKATEVVNVNFVALRKGEAVAFTYDFDRDGFEETVLENEHLRLIISPNAGARAFALVNKHTGTNVFTSVGGLRDKFVELDPQDPTRNPRRKRGMYGTFNRTYAAEIVEGMGKRVVAKLEYDAPDIYPGGVRIERTIVLTAGEEFFTVDYRITPNAKTVDGKQAFWSASSIVLGDPNLKARRVVATDGAFDFSPAKTRVLDVQSGWMAAPVEERGIFAVFWRANEVNAAEVEMKDFSSLINVKFKPFTAAEPYSYRLAFYLGAMTPQQIPAARLRMLGTVK